MGDQMTFPATFDEFAEQYKIVDKQEVYTNGTELIPIFRVKQWLDHSKNEVEKLEEYIDDLNDSKEHLCVMLEEAKAEVARCKDCIYFQPNFVLTNNGERRPYTEEEKNSPLGMVKCDVGINCGSRCERFDYWEDNRFPVWFQENDYCSYFKKKYTEGEKDSQDNN